jgi:hypothetical protein
MNLPRQIPQIMRAPTTGLDEFRSHPEQKSRIFYQTRRFLQRIWGTPGSPSRTKNEESRRFWCENCTDTPMMRQIPQIVLAHPPLADNLRCHPARKSRSFRSTTTLLRFSYD